MATLREIRERRAKQQGSLRWLNSALASRRRRHRTTASPHCGRASAYRSRHSRAGEEEQGGLRLSGVRFHNVQPDERLLDNRRKQWRQDVHAAQSPWIMDA